MQIAPLKVCSSLSARCQLPALWNNRSCLSSKPGFCGPSRRAGVLRKNPGVLETGSLFSRATPSSELQHMFAMASLPGWFLRQLLQEDWDRRGSHVYQSDSSSHVWHGLLLLVIGSPPPATHGVHDVACLGTGQPRDPQISLPPRPRPCIYPVSDE